MLSADQRQRQTDKIVLVNEKYHEENKSGDVMERAGKGLLLLKDGQGRTVSCERTFEARPK